MSRKLAASLITAPPPEPLACKPCLRITDEIFMSAAHALARLVTEADLAQGSLYPALPRIREVSAHIAAVAARVAYRRGLATRKAARGPPHVRQIANVQATLQQPLVRHNDSASSAASEHTLFSSLMLSAALATRQTASGNSVNRLLAKRPLL
jgi:hypothetical protein